MVIGPANFPGPTVVYYTYQEAVKGKPPTPIRLGYHHLISRLAAVLGSNPLSYNNLRQATLPLAARYYEPTKK